MYETEFGMICYRDRFKVKLESGGYGEFIKLHFEKGKSVKTGMIYAFNDKQKVFIEPNIRREPVPC